MIKSKSAIVPVVAVSLLIVMTVVGIYSIQGWVSGFQTAKTAQYDSDLNSKIGSKIDKVIDDKIYFQSNNPRDFTYSHIKIGSITCTTSGIISNGFNTINITNCSSSPIPQGQQDIVLVTQEGVFEKRILVKDSFAVSTS